jgi:UDP-N-acetylmuramoyl-L-alanyl-D-glutamate--2,6-diaminopimelate ligase
MCVIGVTGTDGKTTTATLIAHILKKSGKKVALISTISAIIGDKEYKTGFHVTTPGSFALQSYLRRAKDQGIEVVVIEVTSHALDQNRVFGIPFTIGVLTNVTHEHLDYHKTYKDYLLTKLKLLQNAKIRIVNKDDKSFSQVMHHLKQQADAGKSIITYGLHDADVTSEQFPLQNNALLGEHNQLNVLAAGACCLRFNLSNRFIQDAINTYKPPKGRGEIVYDNDFMVMIDFAHTPNALEQLLKTIKKMKKKGRIIHVFGSAGERDKKKRPMMGEVASRYADLIVLTSEDPRSESAKEICQEISRGIIRVGILPEVYIIEDRLEAITFAIRKAQKGDIVLLTGKGHEESMNLGKGEVPWSDYRAVDIAISKRYAKKT